LQVNEEWSNRVAFDRFKMWGKALALCKWGLSEKRIAHREGVQFVLTTQQEVLDQLGNDATQFYAIHQRYITDAWGMFRLTGETYRQRGGKAVDRGTGSPGRT
jgi:hypothetical protein